MELIPATSLTALILTKNEETNLNRCLNKLTWLERVVILDSFSTDRTLEIAKSYPNVVICQRTFDSFANQCNYGLSLLTSEWVLSLDADYVLTDGFIKETKSFIKDGDKMGYWVKFKFLVFGKMLMGNNTTPRAVLFKLSQGYYYDDGHCHRLTINGSMGNFRSCISHDDRKPLTRWLNNQDGYSIKESEKLLNPAAQPFSLSSKIRKTKVFAPFIVFFHCLFVKGLIFNGWTGWHYTLQRTMVEMLLAIRLIEKENLSKEQNQDVKEID